jgi:hypothetical protein
MGVNLVQLADGSAALRSDRGSVDQLRVGGAAFGGNSYRGVVVVRVPLNAGDTAGGVFAWRAPTTTDVIVGRVTVDVTAPSTGACSVDIGATAVSAATASDNLIDGLSVAAAGVFDNQTDKGANGASRRRLNAGEWVTGSVASGASAGLEGYAYIHYVPAGV